MNIRILNFKLALIFLLVYEMVMLFLGLTGVSTLKLVVTILVWFSFLISVYEYVRNQIYLKANLPYIAYIMLCILLIWNVFNVFRSIINKDGPLTTILGNTSASLAILVPFAIIFSVFIFNLRVLHKYSFGVIKVGIVVLICYLALFGKQLTANQFLTLILLFVPVSFVITSLPFISKKKVYFILAGVFFSLLASYIYSSRAPFVRVILLVLSLVGVFFYYRFRYKFILRISYMLLLVPFVLLQQSYVTGESAFQKYLGNNSDDEYNVDTRTFLYMELYQDLVKNDRMLIGKGANGSYFSDYFYTVDIGETHNRNNLEVGILGILLKGGLIAVVLNFVLLFMAVYFAFFKTNNVYTVGLGYLLIIHVILLFVENYTQYSTYNFFIWFFIGLCLSKKTRSLTDKQIIQILDR